MILLRYVGGVGAPQLVARTEAEDFTGEMLLSAQYLRELGGRMEEGLDPSSGGEGEILVGDDTLVVAADDVVLQVVFDGLRPNLLHPFGVEPTRWHLLLAASILEETGRVYLRQAIGRQQAPPPPAAVPIPEDTERKRIRDIITRPGGPVN